MMPLSSAVRVTGWRGLSSDSQTKQEEPAPKRGMIRRIFGIEEKVYFFLKKTEAVDNDGARRMLAKTVAVSSWAFIATAGLG